MDCLVQPQGSYWTGVVPHGLPQYQRNYFPNFYFPGKGPFGSSFYTGKNFRHSWDKMADNLLSYFFLFQVFFRATFSLYEIILKKKNLQKTFYHITSFASYVKWPFRIFLSHMCEIRFHDIIDTYVYIMKSSY